MPSIRKLTETGQAESVSRQVLALSCKKKKNKNRDPGISSLPRHVDRAKKRKKKDYMQMRSVSADDDNSITKTKLLPIGV